MGYGEKEDLDIVCYELVSWTMLLTGRCRICIPNNTKIHLRHTSNPPAAHRAGEGKKTTPDSE